MDGALRRADGATGRVFLGAVAGYAGGLVAATVAVATIEPSAGVTAAGALVQLAATILCIVAGGVAGRTDAASWRRAAVVAVPVGTLVYVGLVSAVGHVPGAVITHAVLVVVTVTAAMRGPWPRPR